MPVASPKFLQFPVVSLAAEHLVMAYLLRRNILTYKAPPGNEGYDLICIHPDPRKQRGRVVRVQVKSRYQTDCDLGFPVKAKSIDGFDFLVAAFLNVGEFFRGKDGSDGEKPPVLYTFPASFIREHHDARTTWEKVSLRGKEKLIEKYEGAKGIGQIARKLQIPRPTRAVEP